MSSSLTLEQVVEQSLRKKAELEDQIKYLQTQLGQLLDEKRNGLRNSWSLTEQGHWFEPEGEESN